MAETTVIETASRWVDLANQFQELDISEGKGIFQNSTKAPVNISAQGSTRHFAKGSNKGAIKHDSEGDSEYDEIYEEKPVPLRFYRDDGKLFYRYWDFTKTHWVDQDWNDNVVSFDERQAEIFNEEGVLERPTYKCLDGKPSLEINYQRWKLFEAREEDYEYLLRNTWVLESSLNQLDLEPPSDAKVKLQPLDNRLGVPLREIYPKGQQMLIKESRRQGPEWQEGQPLGPDPTNPEHRTTHLGWVPPRFRKRGRGLGGDITDPVQKAWFYGDLDVPVPDKFEEPQLPWSRNPKRRVYMRSVITPDNPQCHNFEVVSLRRLIQKHRLPLADRAGHLKLLSDWEKANNVVRRRGKMEMRKARGAEEGKNVRGRR
ncbi:hypothetical protein F4804DRAFT_332378 [Jackrogersella minutella]|nr:hypothetical protein F4804DRAFT_332378 [Jackrogersella minutella]